MRKCPHHGVSRLIRIRFTSKIPHDSRSSPCEYLLSLSHLFLKLLVKLCSWHVIKDLTFFLQFVLIARISSFTVTRVSCQFVILCLIFRATIWSDFKSIEMLSRWNWYFFWFHTWLIFKFSWCYRKKISIFSVHDELSTDIYRVKHCPNFRLFWFYKGVNFFYINKIDIGDRTLIFAFWCLVTDWILNWCVFAAKRVSTWAFIWGIRSLSLYEWHATTSSTDSPVANKLIFVDGTHWCYIVTPVLIVVPAVIVNLQMLLPRRNVKRTNVCAITSNNSSFPDLGPNRFFLAIFTAFLCYSYFRKWGCWPVRRDLGDRRNVHTTIHIGRELQISCDHSYKDYWNNAQPTINRNLFLVVRHRIKF